MFKHLFRASLFALSSFSSILTGGQSEEFMRTLMIGDLNFIGNVFLTNYAPKEWKEVYAGWNLDYAIGLAKSRVEASHTLSVKDFQRIVKTFFLSSKDYHVVVEFYSTESATLPFLVQSASGRYFFSYIDQEEVSKMGDFPFIIGDELLTVDGRPVADIIQELIDTEIGPNQRDTDRRLAELSLTSRFGRYGDIVPKGAVLITGRSRRDNSIQTVELEWDYTEEKIANIIPHPIFDPLFAAKAPQIKGKKPSKQPFSTHPYFNKEFVYSKYKVLKELRDGTDFDDSSLVMGSRKSCLPPLGEVTWEAPEEKLFHAYLFHTPSGRKAAYIRIPSYSFDDIDKVVQEFAEHMALFQRKADVLVIDQLNNPGGYIVLVYAFAAMLTDKPLDVPQHRCMITQDDVYFAQTAIPFFESITTVEEAEEIFGSTYIGQPVSMKLIKDLLNEMYETVEEWGLGHNFTKFRYLYGLGPLEPHPKVRFTKPILCLVNGLCLSGGDFFPAILQDNKRALIMGSKTGGAGGSLKSVEFPNLTGIKGFKMTGSIALRPNNQLIENTGVTPDIIYEPSIIDLQSNYIEYKRKILRILDTI